MLKSPLACSVALGMLLLSSGARADQLSDIKAKGVLVCGTMGTIEPYSFTNPQTRQVEGYEVDLCKAVADRLGVKLELKLIAAASRIPELQQGRVDILAAVLGWTPERAQQVTYSDQYYVSRVKIASRHADGFKSVYDLAGKRVSATKGGTSEMSVKKMLPDAHTLAFQDPPAAFLALQQGKVDGIALDELALMKLKNQTGVGETIDILEPETRIERQGFGMRNGETAFIQLVNSTLESMETSGEAQKIYDKWMGPGTAYNMKRSFTIAPIKE